MKIILAVSLFALGVLVTAWVTVVVFALQSGQDFEGQECG